MRMLRHPVTGKEMPEFLTGVITPMLTALNEDLTLDEEGNRSLVQWYKRTGAVTTIFARSGTGQMYSYSFQQVKSMIDIVMSEAAGKIHVLTGTSGTFPEGEEGARPDESSYVEETLKLSAHAQEREATGVVVLPLGLQPCANMADKIYRFYQDVNDAIEVPIVIYQPPGVKPPYTMTPSLLRRVAELPNVKGMKYSTTDMLSFGLLCDATKDRDFVMISGHEGAFLPSLVLGAGGVIGGGCNTHPELIREVFDGFMADDLDRARKAQFEVSRLLGMRVQVHDPYSRTAINAAKIYLARKGVRIKPYHWGDRRARRLDDELLDAIEAAIDKAVDGLRSF